MDDDLDADQHTHSLRYWNSPVLSNEVCTTVNEPNVDGNEYDCITLSRDWPLERWPSAILTSRSTASGMGRCVNIS